MKTPAKINTPKEFQNTYKIWRQTEESYSLPAPNWGQEQTIYNERLLVFLFETFNHEDFKTTTFWATYFTSTPEGKTNHAQLMQQSRDYKDNANPDTYRTQHAKYFNTDPYRELDIQSIQNFMNVHYPNTGNFS